MKAVFFDLDGTLCDTLADLTASLNYALRTLDFAVYTPEQVCQMVGNGVRVLCERAVPPDRTDSISMVLALFRAHYSAHCADRTEAYPGMEDALQGFSDAGFTLGVITNKPQASAERILSKVFPEIHFSVIIGQSDRYPLKPDPASLLDSMRNLNLSPSDVTYVGDSDVDLVFSARAGVRAIGCAWGFRGRDFLIRHGADRIADQPSDLTRLLIDLKGA